MNTLKHIYLILIILILSGCGDDGVDGITYVAIIDQAGVTSYTDDNPAIPFGCSFNTWYSPCNSGTYNYSYTLGNGGTWSGSYSLRKNIGSKGGFLTYGEDGKEIRYYLKLTASDGMDPSIISEGRVIRPKPVSSNEEVTNAGSENIKKVYDLGTHSLTITSEKSSTNAFAFKEKYSKGK